MLFARYEGGIADCRYTQAEVGPARHQRKGGEVLVIGQHHQALAEVLVPCQNGRIDLDQNITIKVTDRLHHAYRLVRRSQCVMVATAVYVQEEMLVRDRWPSLLVAQPPPREGQENGRQGRFWSTQNRTVCRDGLRGRHHGREG
jgi:hypothetical protein